MGFNCSESSCCFCCIYKRCFRACSFVKNKTAPEDQERSPPPSIALTKAIDEQSIQDQLSLFHFGQKSGSSGRRASHPNQAKWVEEYERRKSQPASPSPSIPAADPYCDMETVVTPPPPSPVMQYPVVPPGILFI